ncbi:MAG: nuclear transport factor 2 family protein [Henriciella sp.]|uniref:nuclear transport factor 2 family protein n=1 Tax=Henriciella sp. TaxID=1968823 RepID=UPI00261B868B|nr:nuclear transport factor 2 family protein [Henriciella sp.]
MAISLADRDPRAFEEVLTDDFRWVRAGEAVSRGRDAFLRYLADESAADAITIFHVSTDGQTGAVNGEIAMPATDIAFCHVFEFGSAAGNTIKTITSYLIPLAYR